MPDLSDASSGPAPPRRAAELLPAVYTELRRLAAQKLTGEAPGHTLDATSLVHEAYLRLNTTFANPAHFYAAAAEAMRRILVERARRRNAQKRGGGARRADLDLDQLPAPDADADLLALNDALDRLATRDSQAADLVKLRHFAGLTISQAADALGVSPRTADRLWVYARAWLARDLRGG